MASPAGSPEQHRLASTGTPPPVVGKPDHPLLPQDAMIAEAQIRPTSSTPSKTDKPLDIRNVTVLSGGVVTGEWFAKEKEEHAFLGKLVGEAFWDNRRGNTEPFLKYLSGNLADNKKYLIKEIQIALANNDKGSFVQSFQQLTLDQIDEIEAREQLNVMAMRNGVAHPEITQAHIDRLNDYMRDIGFSGVVSITCGDTVKATGTSNIPDRSIAFNIQSQGKVFTGMLAMILIQKGFLTEEDIDKPLDQQLEPHVIEMLAKKGLAEHLKNTTLRQVMTHTSGYGDYLGNHMNKIEEAWANGTELPEVRSPEDQLEFAESEIATLEPGEDKYSNLGSLIFGFALQYHYNKDEEKTAEYTPFAQILREHITTPAGLSSYSEVRPPHARFEQNDASAYVYGGPAGGQWINVADFNKFGQWICKQYAEKKVPPMKELVAKHGTEFSAPWGEIRHMGATDTGTSFFSVQPERGIAIAVLSDQFRVADEFAAKKIYNVIMHEVFTEEEKGY